MTGSQVATRAWLALVILSAATTVLTLIEATNLWSLIVSATLLALAGLKAHVILSRFLGLRASRFWSTTFNTAIAGFLLIGFALVAVAERV